MISARIPAARHQGLNATPMQKTLVVQEDLQHPTSHEESNSSTWVSDHTEDVLALEVEVLLEPLRSHEFSCGGHVQQFTAFDVPDDVFHTDRNLGVLPVQLRAAWPCQPQLLSLVLEELKQETHELVRDWGSLSNVAVETEP